jgi:polyhydroxyalkanoate synthesis regulator phasin
MAQRDLISRLADRSEEVLAKFAETPGAARVLELLNSSRERVDDLQKRVSGLENLERRIDELEKRLAKVEGSAKAPAKAPAKKPAARKPAAPKPPAPKEPPAA